MFLKIIIKLDLLKVRCVLATQAEDLIAGGVRELIHIGFAGGITSDVKIGNVIITDGAYNDTAVAGLYGYNSDFLDTTKSLTNEIEQLFIENHMQIHRGKHWTNYKLSF